MKVLKKGKDIVFKCRGCGAKISIEDGDIIRYTDMDFKGYVICPCCDQKTEFERSCFTNRGFKDKILKLSN